VAQAEQEESCPREGEAEGEAEEGGEIGVEGVEGVEGEREKGVVGEGCYYDIPIAVIITKTLDTLSRAKPGWIDEINNSFLNDEMKEKYMGIVESRFKRMDIQ
jgi:hypothetical protein